MDKQTQIDRRTHTHKYINDSPVSGVAKGRHVLVQVQLKDAAETLSVYFNKTVN